METPTFIESYETGESDLCDRLVETIERMLKHSETNPEVAENIMVGSDQYGGTGKRKDLGVNLRWVNEPIAQEVHALCQKYLNKYVEKYPSFAIQSAFSIDCKIQKTPPKGGFHIWHSEQGFETSTRCLVWTLYLNDMPDNEGETEFLEYGIKVPAKKGILCLFPASFTHTHRGNAVYSHDKYIATGWYNLYDR